jgi:molybdopterin-guanine dinucleotide biosynthesis protein A
MPTAFDAVLLAGGRASRVGGDDKTAFTSGGARLLDLSIAAARGAVALVIVGPRDTSELPETAVVTREDPPWAGPVAALAAGLDAVDRPSPTTLVLACDLPRAPDAVRALQEGRGGARGVLGDPAVHDGDRSDGRDGRIAVDASGRRQPLLALYRTDALRGRLDVLRGEGPLAGLSMRRLLAGLDLVEVPVADELCADVDTPDDMVLLGVEREADRHPSPPMSPATG